MTRSPRKLITWEKWVLSVSAAAAGASLSLFRKYRDTRTVQTRSIVISVLTFLVAFGIIAAVFWYANRPVRENKP
jgi:hypothetical protein